MATRPTEVRTRLRTTRDRRRGKLHVLFENVRALVCRACGHRVFEPPAVETMEHGLNQPSSRKRAARLLVVSA